jgi:hypothetical protein
MQRDAARLLRASIVPRTAEFGLIIIPASRGNGVMVNTSFVVERHGKLKAEGMVCYDAPPIPPGRRVRSTAISRTPGDEPKGMVVCHRVLKSGSFPLESETSVPNSALSSSISPLSPPPGRRL